MTKTGRWVAAVMLVASTIDIGTAALFAFASTGFSKPNGQVIYGWETFWHLFWWGWAVLAGIGVAMVLLNALFEWAEGERR